MEHEVTDLPVAVTEVIEKLGELRHIHVIPSIATDTLDVYVETDTDLYIVWYSRKLDRAKVIDEVSKVSVRLHLRFSDSYRKELTGFLKELGV
jgi:hypothetical protein